MTRALLFSAKLAILIAIAVWLADWNAKVVINLPADKFNIWIWDFSTWDFRIWRTFAWQSYRVDTSVGILLLAAGLLAVLAALLYRYWGGIKRAPRDIGRSLNASREKRGHRALTQGMVAVAAGEAAEAQRWARKASELLDAPPLTMLLSAQAAQLDGDDQAAKRYFTAMLERDETRFLGLRGLITQALRDGDQQAALEHVRAAHALRPRTPWVLESLFDLSQQAGDLEDAERAARETAQYKLLPAADAKRKHAVVLLERAQKAQSAGDPSHTQKLVKQAHKEAPDLVPASVLYAKLLNGSGRRGAAARMLEKAWTAAPHPTLIAAYKDARPGKGGIEWLTQLGKLVAGAPKHPESLLALAEAALDARLWGEARRYLGEATEAGATERVCRLMARLEESEHGDLDRARQWLMRAGEAAPDPAWVCDSCGAVAGEWQPRCGACGAYDGLAWHTPPRVPVPEALAAEPEEAPVLEVAPVEVLTNGEDSAPVPAAEPPAAATAPSAAPVPAPVAEEASEAEPLRRAAS